MRSFEQSKDQLAARGVRTIAISVDPPDVTEDLRKKQKYTYPFLSDVKAEVIRRYDLLHPHGGINNTDIARPAEFLIDSKGVVRWVNLAESYKVRATPDMVNKVLDSLGAPRPAPAARGLTARAGR